MFPKEFIDHVRAWGYDLHPVYAADHDGRATCWIVELHGHWGKTPVVISHQLDGTQWHLTCWADNRQAAFFKVYKRHHGWRVEYWNHWGNWLKFRPSDGPPGLHDRDRTFVQWGVR